MVTGLIRHTWDCENAYLKTKNNNVQLNEEKIPYWKSMEILSTQGKDESDFKN